MIYLTTQPAAETRRLDFWNRSSESGQDFIPRFWRRNSGSIIQAERTGNADCLFLIGCGIIF